MKKQTKKILLSVGAIATTITPISIVLSCGSKTDQQKMNDITIDMVKTALNYKVDSSKAPSLATQPMDKKNVTLNGLAGVDIAISGIVAQDGASSLTAIATVSKKGLTSPKPFTIVWNGFKAFSGTDQDKLNGITSAIIKLSLNYKVDSTKLPSVVSLPTTKTDVTLNGLAGVTITISEVKADDNNGTITATATISKKGLISPKPFTITWSGYQTQNMHDQILMNGITSDMVNDAVTQHYKIKPDPNSPVSQFIPGELSDTFQTTLNKLDNVTVTIKFSDNTFNDKEGKLTLGAVISKPGLTAPQGSPFELNWSGWKKLSDQQIMDGIVSDTIEILLNYVPDITKLPSAAIPPATKTISVNGLAGVTITISGITPDDNAGTLTATAAVSKTGLIPPKGSPFIITWNGFKHN